jgi:hypothetical protein
VFTGILVIAAWRSTANRRCTAAVADGRSETR